MEFPLYQWTAAWLGQQFDLTTALSGRVVSIFCFYLCLPAIVLLLREIRFQPEQINYVLVLVLTAPVFIYFTRAILIESTALCFSLWFLYGFIRLSRSAHWGWWLLTFICGSLAAVVKVTTFMVWGIGALVGGIWWFLKIRRTLGAEQANRNLSWAAISAIPPILAGIWWVATADRIKRQSPDGLFLTSENLRDFNLGSWSDRIDFSVWESLIQNFSFALFPGWIFAILGLGGLAAAVMRKSPMILIIFLWSIAVWLTFPGLYQIHDYYFYAMALIPLLAIGCFVREFGQGLPAQIMAPLVVLAVSGIQLNGYFEKYAPSQFLNSNGGERMELFIRDTFPADEAVVVLGESWSPSIAYYMERRCLMIRDPFTRDPDAFEELLEKWKDVPVSGLLITADYRGNTDLIAALTAQFDLESPVLLTDGNSDLRVGRKLRYRLMAHMVNHPNDHQQLERPAGSEIPLPVPNTDPIIPGSKKSAVTTNQSESIFFQIHPTPSHYRSKFGMGIKFESDRFVMISHPDNDFWVDIAEDATEVFAEFGLQEEVYQKPHEHSDGVSFQLWTRDAAGDESQLFERFADPFGEPADRGKLSISLPLPSPRPTQIRFSTRPGPNEAFDWAYWGNVIVQETSP